jgi:hypothetical protein
MAFSFIDDTFEVNKWEERDRISLELFNETTNEEVFTLWDEKVHEAV